MATTFSVDRVSEIKLNINCYKDEKGNVFARCHNLICTYENNLTSEIKLFGENGKELITSFNSKRAITKTYDHKGKLEKED